MNGDVIRKLLDECLLTDDEMALGPKKWKETMEHLDSIKLDLEDEDEDDDKKGQKEDENKNGVSNKRKRDTESE